MLCGLRLTCSGVQWLVLPYGYFPPFGCLKMLSPTHRNDRLGAHLYTEDLTLPLPALHPVVIPAFRLRLAFLGAGPGPVNWFPSRSLGLAFPIDQSMAVESWAILSGVTAKSHPTRSYRRSPLIIVCSSSGAFFFSTKESVESSAV